MMVNQALDKVHSIEWYVGSEVSLHLRVLVLDFNKTTTYSSMDTNGFIVRNNTCKWSEGLFKDIIDEGRKSNW
ncbi:hypothetical protein AWRI3578_g2784 [Hanseniaspora opuntiae]|uniref:Uncharacterized protein n=1 Tax=Hanseniaspora opuntiae TaxID=211096 RepID=A0A1E5R8P7_9ASCO|nr:hypothetical protein AWRI3578_g2784 [Hanseniaspora opuntiae]